VGRRIREDLNVDALTVGLCDLDVGCRWGEDGELGGGDAARGSSDDLVVRAFSVGWDVRFFVVRSPKVWVVRRGD
jgi:hypothetical protein